VPPILFMYVAGGVLLAALSVPLIQKRIPPNPWYGFRVRQTLDNPDAWYPANAYAGWRLCWVGIATIVGAVMLYFVPTLSLDAYALGCSAITFMGLAVGFAQSWRYLQLPK